MAKPWGGAGAWAAEAEEAEAQAKAASNALPVESFPSLGETMVSSGKTTKKKKPLTFSISELAVGKYVGPGGKSRENMNNSRGLSAEEMMMLPTGPRDRSNEEPESVGGIGGGFRDYGGYRSGGGDRMGDRGDRDSRDRGFGGGFDRDRDGGRGDRMGRDMDMRDDGPSRADEASNWGVNKKSLPSGGGGGYQSSLGGGSMGRGGYDDDTRERGRMSDRDLPSRADEVDNWGSTKKFVPSAPLGGGGGDSFDQRRGNRGGGGFEDAPPRRGGGGGFDDAPGGISRADEVDNWGAAKKFVPSSAPPPDRRGGSGGGGGGFESTYRDAGSEADRWSRREPPPARGDEAPRPAERPRLVLQPRSVPVDNPLPPLLPVDRNGENERPDSSHSTRSDRSLSLRDDTAAPDGQPVPKPRPRSNPFGAARPREEVLAEKGQDWRKIDAELELKRPSSSHSNRSSRPQTPEVGPGGGGEGVPRSRPKVNPFGEARPRDASVERELVNRDWRKPSVAEVVVVDRPETEEEEPALEEEDSIPPPTADTTTEQVVS
ncbi:unnamed protein product [Calypogeia fissa]